MTQTDGQVLDAQRLDASRFQKGKVGGKSDREDNAQEASAQDACRRKDQSLERGLGD